MSDPSMDDAVQEEMLANATRACGLVIEGHAGRICFDADLGGIRYKTPSCPAGKEMFFSLEDLFNRMGLSSYVDEDIS